MYLYNKIILIKLDNNLYICVCDYNNYLIFHKKNKSRKSISQE